jgi:hypothetical protein
MELTRFVVMGSLSRMMPRKTPETGMMKIKEWSAVAPNL